MSIFKNYLLNIITILTGILFPMITFPYVSRVLMPEYIGKIAFTQSIIYYFITLSLLGIPTYAIRELSKNKNNIEKFKKIFTELLIIGIIGSLISFILLTICLKYSTKLQENKDLFIIFSIQIIFSFLNLDYMFIVLENHKRRAIRALILRMISIFCMFWLIKTYKDYKIYVMILVIPEVLIRGLDFLSLKTFVNYKIKLEMRRHMKSLFILFVSAISVGLYANLDSTMLGIMKSDIDVGLYTSASKMTKILIPIIVSLDTVIGPQLIFHIKEKNKDKIFEKINMFLDFNFILGIPIISILFLVSKDIIILFSGEKFLGANLAMKIMLPIILFIPIGSFMSGKILISHNLEKLSLKFNMIGMLSNGLLNYILIPKIGILGAALATVLTEGFICSLKTMRVKKIYPEYIVITKDRIKYLMISVIIALVLLNLKKIIMQHGYFINIILMGTIYMVIYIFILFVLKDKLLLEGIKKIKEKL